MVIRTKRQARAVIGTNWRGRTHLLRCCAIRFLSSDSRALARRGSYQIEYFFSGVEVFLAWMREFRFLGVCVTWIKARKHILQYYFRQPGGIILIRFYRNTLITWYL